MAHIRLLRWAVAASLLAVVANAVNVSTADASRHCKPAARANLTGCNFYRANLAHMNLSHANFSKAILTKANLSGANLTGVNMTRTNVSYANLSNADLIGANLDRSVLTGAKLDADFTSTYFDGPTSEGIVGIPKSITHGWFISKGYLVGPSVNIAGANLEGANLEGANLEGANLEGANLYRANLTNVNFTLTDLGDADLPGENLTSDIFGITDFGGTNLRAPTFPMLTSLRLCLLMQIWVEPILRVRIYLRPISKVTFSPATISRT